MTDKIPSGQWTTELVKEAVEGINGPFVEGDYEFDETSGEKAAAYLNANEYPLETTDEAEHVSYAAFVYDVVMFTSTL